MSIVGNLPFITEGAVIGNLKDASNKMVHFTHNSKTVTLSKRESECFYFLSQAYTTKKIALALNLSPRTIETYINKIKDKMGLIYKTEIVEKAIHYYFYAAIQL